MLAEEPVLDPISSVVGEFGTWQLCITIVIIISKLPQGMHQLAKVFLVPPMNVTCTNPPAEDACGTNCSEYEFDRTVFEETIVSEWELVCDKAYLAQLSHTFFMMGNGFGNIYCGILSDRHGRQKTFFYTTIFYTIFGFMTTYSPEYISFATSRFLTGCGIGGIGTGFTLLVELVGTKHRELPSLLYQIGFPVGIILLSLFAYFFRRWRYLYLVITSPGVIITFLVFYLPESPRWLIAKGQLEKAASILTRGAERNKLPTENILQKLEIRAAIQKASTSANTKEAVFWDLFRHKKLALRTFIMCFNFFTMSFNFFGNLQYQASLLYNHNIFLSQIISGAVMIPGVFAGIILTKLIGRKFTLIIFNYVIAACFAIFIFMNTETLKLLFGSLANFGFSVVVPGFFLFSSEVFPTVLRNAAFGMGCAVSNIGSMISPFSLNLKAYGNWAPALLYASLSAISGLTLFFLPDTSGKVLPETIDDIENPKS